MRPLELALVLVNVPVLAWCLIGRPITPWLRVFPVMALLVLVCHVVFEGPRWHVCSAYLVTVAAFLVWIWPYVINPGQWTAACALTGLATAAIVATVLPVFTMPKPTGPYLVGTTIQHLTDHERAEPQGESPSGRRELMVQIWYPADETGPGRPYRSADEVAFPKDHLALVRTHATENVPVARKQSRYPVVVFSPSWIGRRTQNTVQAVELASHGYFVVGIDHAFATDLTIFPDGRQVRTKLGHPLDYSSDEALQAKINISEDQVRIRAADVRFVIDDLERQDRIDSPGLFAGRIDTAHVAVFGHSFGGAVAAEVCITDPRVRAGANLDGFVFGESLKTGFRKPFLIIETATPCPTEADIAAVNGASRRQLSFIAENTHAIQRGLTKTGGYWVSVQGTSHMNYCDSPLYTPIKSLSHAGPIAPDRAMEIINSVLVEFLRKNLNGDGAGDLNDLAARFPEIELERFAGATH